MSKNENTHLFDKSNGKSYINAQVTGKKNVDTPHKFFASFFLWVGAHSNHFWAHGAPRAPLGPNGPHWAPLGPIGHHWATWASMDPKLTPIEPHSASLGLCGPQLVSRSHPVDHMECAPKGGSCRGVLLIGPSVLTCALNCACQFPHSI